jgi:hypothetical protein
MAGDDRRHVTSVSTLLTVENDDELLQDTLCKCVLFSIAILTGRGINYHRAYMDPRYMN